MIQDGAAMKYLLQSVINFQLHVQFQGRLLDEYGINSHWSRPTIHDFNDMSAWSQISHLAYHLLSLARFHGGQICRCTGLVVYLNLDFSGSCFFWGDD
jgi:hypothetical protein